MNNDSHLHQSQKEWHGSPRAYVIGFISSILLTLTSFTLVSFKLLEGSTLIYTIIFLAITQALVQLRYFLHLGQELQPRHETHAFYSMLICLIVIILGTLWIMFDLNQRVMSHMIDMPKEMKHD